MSVEIEKICRTCLALSGPLLSIYDGGTYGDTIATMLRDFTKMKPSPTDNMPQKVCLTCISEINRCYSFKMKCENSNRTLRQLLQLEDDSIMTPKKDSNILFTSRSVQTTPEREILKKTIHVQTSPVVKHSTDSVYTEVGLQGSQENNSNGDFLESLADSTNITSNSKGHKRRATTASTTAKTEQSYKKTISENYNIDSNEDGYEFILKLDTNSQTDVNTVKEINDETVVVNPTSCIVDNDNTEAYEIADGNFDCEEYEIEAVVEDEDQTLQSDEVVIVKRESMDGKDNSQKSFVIVKSIEEVKSSQQKERKKTNVKKEYGCTECVMSFYSLKVLRRHLSKLHGLNEDKVHLDDIKYRVLGKNDFSTTNKTQKNNTDAPSIEEEDSKDVTSHSQAESKEYSIHVCSTCKSAFSSQRALKYHKTKNICNAKSYECDQCERVFTSADNLKSHKASHNNAAVECPECRKTFMTTEELSSHQISVHKRSARNQCSICKKVFTMLSTLRDHMRTHSGEKPFLCTICGKAFTQKANLKQHIQRHDKDKKFKCDECSNTYVTKAELFSHKRSHNGDHPYKCEECSATFTTSSSLVKHRRRHTGERPYACDICPMRFAVLNVLKNHRRLHTGEKPYSCPHCDKKFTQRGDCMIHVSKHGENNTFLCTCGKSFAHASLLRQHSKRYHPELYERKAVHIEVAENVSGTVVNYAIGVEVDGESETQQDDDDDMVEMNLETICGS